MSKKNTAAVVEKNATPKSIQKLNEFLKRIHTHLPVDHVDFELYDAKSECSTMKVWLARKKNGCPYFEFFVTRGDDNTITIKPVHVDIHDVAVNAFTMHELRHILKVCLDAKPIKMSSLDWKMLWRDGAARADIKIDNPFKIDIYDHCGH